MKTLNLQEMENLQGGGFWGCMGETGGKKIGTRTILREFR